MMLRNLLDGITRRRQWPLVAIAALVVIAVPLLLLGSSSDDEPTADLAAPAAPAAGKLPARAQRLLDATEVAASGGSATGASRDPFAPPSSYRAALAQAAAAGNGTATAKSGGSGSSSASVAPPKQTPIVIENPTAGAQQGSGSGSATTPSKKLTVSNAVVDIRFGKVRDTPIKRAIPRLKTFFIHGKLAAVFVKYSPSRKKAVFAVAPNVVVTGVKCRNQDGVCRYVDLAAGDHAWLTMVTASKTIVNRRLDVVHIKRGSTSASTSAKAASASDENACLLRKLQAAKLWDVVERDACER